MLTLLNVGAELDKNTMEFVKELLKAAPVDTCESAISFMQHATSVSSLLQLMKRNIDFCLINNYPTMEMLTKYAEEILIGNGIFIDKFVDLHNPSFALLYGSCYGNAILNELNVCEFYLKGKSRIDIILKDSSFAVIDLLDNSFGNIAVLGHSKALVNLYGNATLNYSGDGTIKVVRKNSNTY